MRVYWNLDGFVFKKLFAFTLLSILLATLAWAKGENAREMVIYRFYSKGSRNQVNTAIYEHRNHLYEPKYLGVLQMHPPQGDLVVCNTLMNHLQNFALNLMKTGQYLDEVEFKKQANDISQIDLDQVTFITVDVPVSKTEFENHPEKFENSEIVERPPIYDSDTTFLRQAAMRVVGGQYLYPYPQELFDVQHPGSGYLPDIPWQSALKASAEKPDVLNPHTLIIGLVPMPWQLNQKLKVRLEAKPHQDFDTAGAYVELDRKKYPLRWEIGRTGSLETEYLADMLKAAVTVINEEITTSFQSREEDAYVFVHALDDVRRRRFEREGFKALEGACALDDVCL